jgi:hypothetical protein
MPRHPAVLLGKNFSLHFGRKRRSFQNSRLVIVWSPIGTGMPDAKSFL